VYAGEGLSRFECRRVSNADKCVSLRGYVVGCLALERVSELEYVIVKRLVAFAKKIVNFGSEVLFADTEDMIA